MNVQTIFSSSALKLGLVAAFVAATTALFLLPLTASAIDDLPEGGEGDYALVDCEVTIQGSESGPYPSINLAIAEAEEGDTLTVTGEECAGPVSIDEDNLTLETAEGTMITSNTIAQEGVVAIEANNVTVRGFVIDNEAAADGRAVRISDGVTGATIEDVTLQNSYRGIQGNWSTGAGVELTVTGSTFMTDYGIAGTDEFTVLEVFDNDFQTTVEAIGLGKGSSIYDRDYIDSLLEDNDWNLVDGYAVGDHQDNSAGPTKFLPDGRILVENGDSIQASIDAADADDTIVVEETVEGSYEEDVNVNKAVILQPLADGPVELRGVMTVSEPEATVEGFSIAFPYNGGDGAPNVALLDLQVGDLTITDNMVDNSYRNAGGIMPWSGTGPVDGDSAITGSVVDGAIGVYLGGTSDMTISNNEVRCSAAEGIWVSSFGGEFSFADVTLTIEDNDISKCISEGGDGPVNDGEYPYGDSFYGYDSVSEAADMKIDTKPQSLNGMTGSELDDLEAVAWYVLTAQTAADSIELWDEEVYHLENLSDPDPEPTRSSGSTGTRVRSTPVYVDEDSSSSEEEEEESADEPAGEVLGAATSGGSNVDDMVAMILEAIMEILASIQTGLAEGTMSEAEAAELLASVSELVALLTALQS